MAVKIANLKILVSANTRGLVGGLSKAKTQVSGFRTGVSKVGAGLTKFIPILAGVAAGVLSIATVTKLATASVQALSKQFAELDKLGKTASKIGVTVEALQKMRFAGKLAGVEVTTVDMALQRFTRRTAEAAVGTGEALAAFVELGINAKEFSKLSLDDQMKGLADAMGRFSDDDQLRLAFKLFDSEGAALVNTLKGGSEALDAMFKDRGELGLFTSEQVARIESANDNMTRLGVQVKFIIGSIAASLAPILDELVATLVDIGKQGEFSFDKIGESVRDMAIGLGIAADVMIKFIKLQAVATKSMTGLAGLAFEFRDQLGGLVPAIGLADFDTPIADKVRGFFDDVAARTDKIKDNSEVIRDNILSPPGGEKAKEPEAVAKSLKAIPALIATLPAALEKGSAAAFSLIARTRRGRGIEDVSKWTEATVKELEAQSQVLRDIANKKPGTLAAASL